MITFVNISGGGWGGGNLTPSVSLVTAFLKGGDQ